MLVRTLSTNCNEYSHLVTNSEWTLLIHKATDTVLTYKTARLMVPEPVDNSPDRPTDSLDENISFTWRYVSSDRQPDRHFYFNTEFLQLRESGTDRQTDRQTEERNVYQINLKLKTFRHRQRKLCMRLMDIAADVTSSLKFKLNDLTSFSSHIMTLRHMVAAAET